MTLGSSASIGSTADAGANSMYASSRTSSVDSGRLVDERAHPVGVVPGPHRVVGIGQEDERCIEPAHRIEQRFEIDAVVAVGHRLEHPAEARDVEVERRVCPARRDHRHPRLDDHPHHVAEHLVDAGAEQDLVDGHAVTRGNRAAQIECLGVVVPGDARDGFPHGLGRPGGDAERALVRADPDPKRFATPTLERLGADERNRRWQAVDQRGEPRCSGHHRSLMRERAREYLARTGRSRNSGDAVAHCRTTAAAALSRHAPSRRIRRTPPTSVENPCRS